MNDGLIDLIRGNILSGSIALIIVIAFGYVINLLSRLYRKILPDGLTLNMSKKQEELFSAITLALLIGIPTTFLLVKTQIDYSHIEERETDVVAAHYSHYEIRGYRSRRMYIFFSDHDKLLVRWYGDVVDNLKEVDEGEELVMKLHPTGGYAMSINARDKTILDFAYTQKKAETERIGFLIICFVMYLDIIVILMIGRSKRTRSGGRKRPR